MNSLKKFGYKFSKEYSTAMYDECLESIFDSGGVTNPLNAKDVASLCSQVPAEKFIFGTDFMATRIGNVLCAYSNNYLDHHNSSIVQIYVGEKDSRDFTFLYFKKVDGWRMDLSDIDVRETLTKIANENPE